MFSRGFATGRTSAHNVHICTARVLTGSTLMPAQIAGSRATAVTSDIHAARLTLQRMSEPSADSARPIVAAVVGNDTCRLSVLRLPARRQSLVW